MTCPACEKCWRDDDVFEDYGATCCLYGGPFIGGSNDQEPIAQDTHRDCMELIAHFQQEDRDTAIKSTRYIGEGIAFIIHPEDNDKDKKPTRT